MRGRIDIAVYEENVGKVVDFAHVDFRKNGPTGRIWSTSEIYGEVYSWWQYDKIYASPSISFNETPDWPTRVVYDWAD